MNHGPHKETCIKCMEERSQQTKIYRIVSYVYIWANSFDKAMIEIARGNYYKNEATARRQKPKKTGLSFWAIRFTEEVEK